MKTLVAFLCLSFAVLLFSPGEAWSLPRCPGSDANNTWTNCFGNDTAPNGDKYLGEWKDGKHHGQGTSDYANGDKYVGGYRNDKYHGQGIYTFASGSKYVGEYRRGKRRGQGTYTHANGDKYVGEYRNDKYQGQGTSTYANGDKYVGEYRRGKRRGQGTYTHANGDKYVGEFRDDKYHGQGTLTLDDGRVLAGIWRNNEFQYARKDPKIEERRKAERETKRLKQEQIAREKREEKRRQADKEKVIAAASGTGFVVSNSGHIVTNNHVIDGCQEVKVHTDGDVYKAKILRRDTVNDLAVIKANFKPSRVLAISGEDVEELMPIVVAGFPFGTWFSSSIKFTRGIVSSLSGIGDNYSRMQIDAALQPGNSGGPIIDENGNVVGVAVAKLGLKVALEEFGAIPEGTNFGIKSTVVRSFLKANGVKLRKPSNDEISRTELVEQTKGATLFLTCWMTYAQIKEQRTEKVMFKDLQ